MHLHHQFSLATDMPVYFCYPLSPWQRGSNENTVPIELNNRPRKTLNRDTPAERLANLLANTN